MTSPSSWSCEERGHCRELVVLLPRRPELLAGRVERGADLDGAFLDEQRGKTGARRGLEDHLFVQRAFRRVQQRVRGEDARQVIRNVAHLADNGDGFNVEFL